MMKVVQLKHTSISKENYIIEILLTEVFAKTKLRHSVIGSTYMLLGVAPSNEDIVSAIIVLNRVEIYLPEILKPCK